MTHNFFIIGGERKNYILARKLKDDGNDIKIMGFENLKSKDDEIENINDMKEIKKDAFIVSSIPLTMDGENIYAPYSNKKIKLYELEGKNIIAGNIPERLKGYDILKDNVYNIENTIPLAETVIKLIMQEIDFSIINSKILVIGFEKESKIICNILKNIGAKVYCTSKNENDLAWIETLGYNKIELMNLKNEICKMDVIINTLPDIVIDKKMLILMSQESLIVNLNKNKNVDEISTKKLKIKTISNNKIIKNIKDDSEAELIKEYIYRIIKK